MSDDILTIHTYGDPILRKKAEPVDSVDDDIRQLADEMIDAMFADKGIGLAAPQVGVSKRLVVVDLSVGERVDETIAFVNPEIYYKSEGSVLAEEGCLSVPDVYADVERAERIKLRYHDLDGHEHEMELDGYRARILQHEIDHLDGILFVDRISAVKKSLIAKKLKQIQQKGNVA